MAKVIKVQPEEVVVVQPDKVGRTNELTTIVKQSGIDLTKGQMLETMFKPFFAELDTVEKQIQSLPTENPSEQDMQAAREIRLALVKKRTSAEDKKTELKRQILIEGRLIDSLYNVVKNTMQLLEEKCLPIEKYDEIQKQKRIEALVAKRTEILKPYNVDVSQYNLATMSEQAFENVVNGLEYEIEQKKIGEEQRLKREEEERRERERLEAENEKLRKEQAKKDKLLQAEREKREKERQEEEKRLKDIQEKNRREQEQRDREHQAQLNKERQQRERLEQEQRERERAEREEQKRLEQQARKEAKAPDKKKLLKYAQDIQAVPFPEIKDEDAKVIVNDIRTLLNKFVNYINQQAEKL